MTHDELLGNINKYIRRVMQQIGRNNSTELGILNALRAVVKRHMPDEYGYCSVCVTWVALGEVAPTIYPCPTIQDVEKELK